MLNKFELNNEIFIIIKFVFHFKMKFKTRVFCYIILVCILLVLFRYRILVGAPTEFHESIHQQSLSQKPRIFCIIPTSDDLDTVVKTVYESWVYLCDNHTFISLIPGVEPTPERAEIKYQNLFYVAKPANFTKEGSRYNLTKKIYAAFRDVYSNHKEYDWYLQADADTFVFVDNLRLFLQDKKPLAPVVFGYDFKTHGGYQSGGAGYVLSKESIYRLGEKLLTAEESCPNNGVEDMNVGQCLRKVGVNSSKSIDEFGRERFHIFSLPLHFGNYTIEWVEKYSANSVRSVKCLFSFASVNKFS